MKMHIKTGTARIKIGINIKTDTETTAMTKLEVGTKKKSAHMMIQKMIILRQNLRECKEFYKQWVQKKKWQ